MLHLDHLSYSSVCSYLACPRGWKFHYVDQVEVPTAGALAFGSAYHETVGAYTINCVADPKNVVPLADIWPIKWREQIEQRGRIAWGNDTMEGLLEMGLRILRNKDIQREIDSISPLLDATGAPRIEEFISLQVPGVPIPIIGYVDLITDDGIPCDIKTATRAWSKDRPGQETQPTFYLAALNQAGYDLNPDMRFRYYVFTKSKTPKVQVLETRRAPGDLVWLLGMVRDVWSAIKAGEFPPNPTTWKCDPRYCDYWDICRGGK